MSSPARLVGPDAAMLAALAAFLGHPFPVWLNFKGGKGVAVYIGVLIDCSGRPGSICVLWAATAATSRYSSLSALIASFSVTPWILWWFGHPALASLFAALTLLFYVCTARTSRGCMRDRGTDRGEE